MAQFLRGKQAGIQRDLSEGLSPELFQLDDVRLGAPGILFLAIVRLTQLPVCAMRCELAD